MARLACPALFGLLIKILRGLWVEYQYERDGGFEPRLRSAWRAGKLVFGCYLNPRQPCGFCQMPFWTITPWAEEGVCGHPNCEEAKAHGNLGMMIIVYGEPAMGATTYMEWVDKADAWPLEQEVDGSAYSRVRHCCEDFPPGLCPYHWPTC